MKVREKTIKHLSELKAPRKMKGYRYFIDALEILDSKGIGSINEIEARVYIPIAKKYKTTQESVRMSLSRFKRKICKTAIMPTNQEFLIYKYHQIKNS